MCFSPADPPALPKGVIVRHRGISPTRARRRVHRTSGRTIRSSRPRRSRSMPPPWKSGCPSAARRPRRPAAGDSGPSLPAIARAIREHGVTCLWLTAGLFQTMVDEHLPDLKGLRYLLAGGDALSPVARPPRLRGPARHHPDQRLRPHGKHDFHLLPHGHLAPISSAPPSPSAWPVGNTTVHLLDSGCCVPSPPAFPESCSPAATASHSATRIRPDSPPSGSRSHPDYGRLYRTGDLCRSAAGRDDRVHRPLGTRR